MDTQQAAPRAAPVTIDWRQIAGLVLLSLKIFLLRILTLGIYHFWGKTEVRRKIWSAVHLQNQPLEYTGTGKELLLGFLIVTFLIIIPIYVAFVGISLYFGEGHPATVAVQLILGFAIVFLIGMAQYRARRYRLSRTNWRGIRGGMSGSALRYAWTSVWTVLLIPLTLGWIVPWRSVTLQRILTNETRFGQMPMRFEGDSGPLYLPFLGYWLGFIGVYGLAAMLLYQLLGEYTFFQSLDPAPASAPPSLQTIGIAVFIVLSALLILSIISAWYTARLYNHFAASTHIDHARFHLTATPLSLIGLTIGNFLLTLLTFGIATPIVQTRLARYFVTRLNIEGMIDFDQIAQSQAALSRTGEGLAEAFDVDAF